MQVTCSTLLIYVGENMYQFKEDWDSKGHFWFDKQLIENKNWANMTQAGKSVFPVIASHRNNLTGEAFPCERTIAILAGRSDKIVRNGIRDLEDMPGIEFKHYITRKGRKSKKFFIDKPPNEKGRAFPFYKAVLETGIWSRMKPTAQALYPVMLHFGYYDPDIYSTIEDDSSSIEDPIDFFPNRKWDICDADLDILSSYAGITQRSIKAALLNLESVKMIESDNKLSRGWKVFIRPKAYYKRDFLNSEIADKYRHLVEQ
jgi:hypothetical protein